MLNGAVKSFSTTANNFTSESRCAFFKFQEACGKNLDWSWFGVCMHSSWPWLRVCDTAIIMSLGLSRSFNTWTVTSDKGQRIAITTHCAQCCVLVSLMLSKICKSSVRINFLNVCDAWKLYALYVCVSGSRTSVRMAEQDDVTSGCQVRTAYVKILCFDVCPLGWLPRGFAWCFQFDIFPACTH